MQSYSQPIGEQSLRDLHPKSVDDAFAIRSLLAEARDEQSLFYRGLNALIDLEVARLVEVSATELVLETENFDRRALDGQIFLNFSVGGRPYFFESRRIQRYEGRKLVLALPRTIFHRERRDRARWAPRRASGEASRVSLSGLEGGPREAEIRDRSPSGFSLLLRGERAPQTAGPLTARFLDGRERGREARLELKSAVPATGRAGWIRLGLVRVGEAVSGPLPIEHWETLEGLNQDGTERIQSRASGTATEAPRVIRLPGVAGQELVGLLDGWGEPQGATAVVMPNGWGQTKEALLPLARTLVSTFRAHGLPIQVIRFDGVQKRGESYRDPESRRPGHESDRFVFSQGVRDIGQWVDYLRESPDHGASRVILLSFSASAIEARKAVALDGGRGIDGWISVVGSPDLQSMAKSISGGVDYVGGHERGHSFGFQELLGVRVDIDRIAVDAQRHGMSFLEDSRRDLASIRTPITWFHGRYDAWVDLARVQEILSQGDVADRRLIEMPTGHQLRTSRQASLAFQHIARELGQMALGRDLEAVAPPTSMVRNLRLAEHRRLPQVETDLHSFWHDYLVGRDGSIGIELLTASSAYRALMEDQISCLDGEPDLQIADLGAGTGALAIALATSPSWVGPTEVYAMDYVRPGLRRATERLEQRDPKSHSVVLCPVETNLDLAPGGPGIPVADMSFDRVMASLLIGYLAHPERLLSEMFRILRPGGRMVLSSLGRDADISLLYVEAFEELKAGKMRSALPELALADGANLARNFLNDAARILELEDMGAFRFMDAEELFQLALGAGFVDIDTRPGLGVPPQAVILSAARPAR